MDDNDSIALVKRVERTLAAATQAIAQDKAWADRVRANWSRPEPQDDTEEVIYSKRSQDI